MPIPEAAYALCQHLSQMLTHARPPIEAHYALVRILSDLLPDWEWWISTRCTDPPVLRVEVRPKDEHTP